MPFEMLLAHHMPAYASQLAVSKTFNSDQSLLGFDVENLFPGTSKQRYLKNKLLKPIKKSITPFDSKPDTVMHILIDENFFNTITYEMSLDETTYSLHKSLEMNRRTKQML